MNAIDLKLINIKLLILHTYGVKYNADIKT